MNKIIIKNEEQLDLLITTPNQMLIDYMKKLDGDIIILGVAGKMGVNLAVMAARAIKEAGVKKRVVGVARFSNPIAKEILEQEGIETTIADLSNPEEVNRLELVKNVIYMVAKKFGTDGAEDLTWVMNTLVPGYVARHFRKSSIVSFSTGCVYPLVAAESGGCTEETQPAPLGNYASSALGREMMFNYACRTWGTKVCHFRLNYSVDLRYGVLHDICQKIMADEIIDLSAGHFNCIWQGDAVSQALLCLQLVSSPAKVINITGPEIVTTKYAATQMAKILNKKVTFTGEPKKTFLANASKAIEVFGKPKVDIETLLDWQAEWILQGGRTLGKPTKFEVSDGKF